MLRQKSQLNLLNFYSVNPTRNHLYLGVLPNECWGRAGLAWGRYCWYFIFLNGIFVESEANHEYIRVYRDTQTVDRPFIGDYPTKDLLCFETKNYDLILNILGTK